MAMFSKKVDADVKKVGADAKPAAELGAIPQSLPPLSPAAAPAPQPPPPARTYGIAETIQLMRTLPVDHNGELVVRVVRATLESLKVRPADIIEDATRKQKGIRDRITAVHGDIANLERELEARRAEIASLEADLDETTAVKERLQVADGSAASLDVPIVAPATVSTTLLGVVPS